MLWDPFLYCINDSIQGKSETGNKVFVLPSKVSINSLKGEKTKGLKATLKFAKEHDMCMTEAQIQGANNM